MKFAAVLLGVALAAAGIAAQGKDDRGDREGAQRVSDRGRLAGRGRAREALRADGVEMPPNAPAAKGRAAIEAFHKAFGSSG